MDRETTDPRLLDTGAVEAYEPPRFQVISLSCEITAYAPDDEPLF